MPIMAHNNSESTILKSSCVSVRVYALSLKKCGFPRQDGAYLSHNGRPNDRAEWEPQMLELLTFADDVEYVWKDEKRKSGGRTMELFESKTVACCFWSKPHQVKWVIGNDNQSPVNATPFRKTAQSVLSRFRSGDSIHERRWGEGIFLCSFQGLTVGEIYCEL